MNATSVDEDVTRMVEYLGDGLLLLAIAFLGIVGNVVSLIVLSKPQMRTAAINCCLQSLAAFDGLLVVCSVFMLGLRTLGQPWNRCHLCRRYRYELLPHIMPILYPVALTAHTGSVWSTVSVTIERYIAVCHPLHARNLCTYRRARMGVLGVAAFALCYNLPRFWEYKRVTYFNTILNETVSASRPTSLRKNLLYVNIYHNWLYLIFIVFGPMLALSVLNFRIWRTVRRANLTRQSLTHCQKGERRLTSMLFCVVLVFFVCHVTLPVVNVYDLLQNRRMVRLVSPISNCLVVLNSSVNVFIYCVYCNKFRLILVRILCPGKRRERHGSSSRRATMTTVDLIRRKTKTLSKTGSSDTTS